MWKIKSMLLLLMKAHKFCKVMRLLNMSLQNIPLRLYHIHLQTKAQIMKYVTGILFVIKSHSTY